MRALILFGFPVSIGDGPIRVGTLNTSHRADIAALYKCGVFDQNKVGLAESVVRNNTGAFIWPDINEEDLLEGRNMLMLLESRSQYPRACFIRFDRDVLRLLDGTCFRTFRCPRTDDGNVVKTMHPTGCNPPKFDPETGKETIYGACVHWRGTTMDVLERQIPIMEFLVSFRDLVLQEASSINLLQKAPLLLPSDQSEKTHIQDWQCSLRYLHLPPKVDNLKS